MSPIVMELPKKIATAINIEHPTELMHVRLQPGEYFATDLPMILTTLLGSCIAVCLYDSNNGIAGMNHFLLSNKRYSKNIPICLSEAGRYGVNAMELLINDMLKLGAIRKFIEAKVFGGANVLLNCKNNFSCVSDVNVRFIKDFLENEKIPITASNLGGQLGRVIHFNSLDFSVYMRKIKRVKTIDIESQEENIWAQKVKKISQEEKQPDLWI